MNNIKTKGIEGELALKNWFDDNGLSYLYVDQSTDTFATLFKRNLKRPDFLLLMESIGMLAIDVKNYKLSGGVFTLGLADEFQKALTFERLFRLPLWYVYKKDNEWYWISALKAIEVGSIRKNNKTGKDFLAIPIQHCEMIIEGVDLGKLFTHRLPSINKLAATPPENDRSPSQLEYNQYYEFQYDYTPARIKKITSLWKLDVEFSIVCRRGEDLHFSTKENKCDSEIVALIDRLTVEVMYKLDCFMVPATVYGSKPTTEYPFSIDHLIYAVESIFYDDKSGSFYSVTFNAGKLTNIANKKIKELSQQGFSVDAGMNYNKNELLNDKNGYSDGYAIFLSLE